MSWGMDRRTIRSSAELSTALCNSDLSGLSGWTGIHAFLSHPQLKFVFGVKEAGAYLAIAYEISVADCTRDSDGNAAGNTVESLCSILPLRIFVEYCRLKDINRLTFVGHGAGGNLAFVMATKLLSSGTECLQPTETDRPLTILCATFGALPLEPEHLSLPNSADIEQKVYRTNFVHFNRGHCSVVVILRDLWTKGFEYVFTKGEVPNDTANSILQCLQDGAIDTGNKEGEPNCMRPHTLFEVYLSQVLEVFELSGVWKLSGSTRKRIVEERDTFLANLDWGGRSDSATIPGRPIALCGQPSFTEDGENNTRHARAQIGAHGMDTYLNHVKCIYGEGEASSGGADSPPADTYFQPKVDRAECRIAGKAAEITIFGKNLDLLYSLDVRIDSEVDLYIPISTWNGNFSPEKVSFILDGGMQNDFKVTRPVALENLKFYSTATIPRADFSEIVVENGSCSEDTKFDRPDEGLEILNAAYMQIFAEAVQMSMESEQKRSQLLLKSPIVRSFRFFERELLGKNRSMIEEALNLAAVHDSTEDEVRAAHAAVSKTLDEIKVEIMQPVYLSTKFGKACGIIGLGVVATALLAVSPLHTVQALWLTGSSLVAGASTITQVRTQDATGYALRLFQGDGCSYRNVLEDVVSLLVDDQAQQSNASVVELEDKIFREIEIRVISSQETFPFVSPWSVADETDVSRLRTTIDFLCPPTYKRLTAESKCSVLRLAQIVLNIRRLRVSVQDGFCTSSSTSSAENLLSHHDRSLNLALPNTTHRGLSMVPSPTLRAVKREIESDYFIDHTDPIRSAVIAANM